MKTSLATFSKVSVPLFKVSNGSAVAVCLSLSSLVRRTDSLTQSMFSLLPVKTFGMSSTAGADGGNDEERMQHAMADPEIQKIMNDPTIR